MESPLEIHSGLLARNTVLNLAGYVVPLVVGFLTIPYVVRGLGNEGFGILSIAWVLLGYIGLFDLGLGRATTKFVAECLGRGDLDQLPGLVWTSLVYQMVLGLVGGLLVASFIPILVERILRIPLPLVHETKISFFLLAASLPVVLATSALRSVLESAQRFDLVNYVKVPANVSVFLLPAFAVAVGLRLPGIILLLVLSRLVATLAYLAVCLKIFPTLGQNVSFDSAMLRPLFAYGGWVTVSGVVSPILVNADRLVIGALISMAAVGYYTAPAEIVGRLLIFPSSLVATLFPAFSSLGAGGARERLEKLYARSVKFLLLALGPLLVLLIVFARQILRFWLGGDFAAQSTATLQILSVGVLLNSLALVPYTLIQGLGRPDVTAKFHLLELPIYGLLVWFLTSRMGIAGTALACTLRACIDALLLFTACSRLRFMSFRGMIENGFLRTVVAITVFAAVLSLALLTGKSLLIRSLFAFCLVILFQLCIWGFVLDGPDKGLVISAFRQVAAIFGTADEK